MIRRLILAIVVAVLGVLAGPLAYAVAAPMLSIEAPANGSVTNQKVPAVEGTSTDSLDSLTVSIEKGGGTVETRKLQPEAGTGHWSAGFTTPLSDGSYAVVVEQTEELTSEAATASSGFSVTSPKPKVTLSPISSPANDATPTFAGEASESTPVKIHIYAGTSATGAVVSEAQAAGTGGAWSSAAASPALADGTYTAVAEQESESGAGPGVSGARTFTVHAAKPHVTLAALTSPVHASTPSFTGTGSEKAKVIVYVFAGTISNPGNPVSEAQATGTGAAWKSAAASPPLADGTYVAIAEQLSEFGNGSGYSEWQTFTVNTAPPTVTVDPVPSPSNQTHPTLEGTASDTTPVSVQVFRGNSAKGSTIATASAPVEAGHWKVALSGELGRGEYFAIAKETSSFGSGTGQSGGVSFIVAPGAPTMHLNAPAAEINNSTPSFSGTSSEGGKPVVVKICPAPGPCNALAPAHWTATSPTGAAWTTGATTPALPDGAYRAVATQESVTRELGASAEVPFTVDTTAPTVTLTAPASGATVPGASVPVQGGAGAAVTDSPAVTVQLFSGAVITAGASPQQALQVGVIGGRWAATLTGVATGSYVLRALQSDRAGNLGVSASVAFKVLSPAGATGPAAGFTWYPSHPHTGETVSLASSSVDALSPLTAYAWSLSAGPFAAGAQTKTTTFAMPGSHLVQLRVTDSAGRTSVASGRIPVTYPLLRPFPRVRIVTTRTVGRVRLVVLSVQAPAGATIELTCTGKGCPRRAVRHAVKRGRSASAVVVFPAFERSLVPGIGLQIRVFEAGRVGKYTSFTIRRGKLPIRSDSCLEANSPAPVKCSV